jgi:hypothetical protein
VEQWIGMQCGIACMQAQAHACVMTSSPVAGSTQRFIVLGLPASAGGRSHEIGRDEIKQQE